MISKNLPSSPLNNTDSNSRSAMNFPSPKRKAKSTFSTYLKSRENNEFDDNNDTYNNTQSLPLKMANLDLHTFGLSLPYPDLCGKSLLESSSTQLSSDSYYKEQNAELKTELEDLKKQVKRKDKELNSLIREISKLSDENTHCLQKISEFALIINKKESEISQLNDHIAVLVEENKQIALQYLEISQLKENLSHLTIQLQTKENFLTTITEQDEMLDNLESALEQLAAEYEEAKQLLIEKDARINDLMFQIVRLTHKPSIQSQKENSLLSSEQHTPKSQSSTEQHQAIVKLESEKRQKSIIHKQMTVNVGSPEKQKSSKFKHSESDIKMILKQIKSNNIKMRTDGAVNNSAVSVASKTLPRSPNSKGRTKSASQRNEM